MKSLLGRLQSVFSGSNIEVIFPNSKESSVGAGFNHKGKTYITHTELNHEHSAIRTILPWQQILILTIISVLFISFVKSPIATATVFVAAITIIYFLDVLFNMFLIAKSLHFPPELSFTPEQIAAIDDKNLPIYTILCPMYRESAVLPDFVKSMAGMDWPKDKLEVLLLLEEDDQVTIDAAKKMDLPKYIKTLVVPHSFPKTKPKACNYGLCHSHGKYLVIYDAEDQPEPSQLKKAYLGFQQTGERVACLQAKLNYFNPNHNLLTRLFTSEYSLWFDVTLPGMQSIETNIPLGGTSNHFRTEILKELRGWDAFNVTEDADLGARLFKLGFRTAIIDSTTLEEANSKVGNWFRQRSRWIKGYMQTFLVHNRHPLKFIKSHGIHAFIFQLTMGGKIAFMIINPLLWLITFSYFLLYRFIGPTIESLYPSVIFYMAAFSLVVGNFLYLYYYMIGCAKRGHWHLIKYVYIIPVYWLMISIAALKAAYQLITKPHYWEKTTHGLHLQVKKDDIASTLSDSPRAFTFFPQFVGRFTSKKWSGAAALVTVSIFSNFLNFLYNAYLGNRISLDQFGLISLFGSFLYIAQIPFSAFSRAVTRVSAFAFGRQNKPVKKIWSTFYRWSLISAIVISVIWLLLSPALRIAFKSASLSPFIIFAPIWIIGLLSSVNSGYLSGSQRFGILALAAFLESFLKLISTIILVQIGLKDLVYISIPLSMFISFIICWYWAKSVSTYQAVDYEDKIVFPIKFTITGILNRLSTVVFLGMDVILAKLLLSPNEAGKFALLSLIGKMVYFFGTLSNQFVVPLVSKEEGAKNNPIHIFNKILLATIITTSLGFVGVGLFGWLTVPVLFGSRAHDIIPFLHFYILGISAFTIANTIIVYHQTRNKLFVPVFGFLVSFIQIVFLMSARHNLSSYVYSFGFMGVLQLLVAGILHRLTRYSTAINQNTFALFDLFRKDKTKPKIFEGQLRFLILNWRDTKHTWAGGAEVYVQELAKQFVADGNQVTIFCGNDGKCKRSEVIDGVTIIRRGGFFTVYIWAMLYYILKFQDKFDVIIDSENGIPFFTPLYSRRPKFLLIHHVHQKFFRDNLKFPMRQIACFLEAKLMPLAYRNEKIITVSESSKKDIANLGYSDPKNISVVNPGIKIPNLSKVPRKAVNPRILYLGRIRSYKNIDIAIRAFQIVVKKYPAAKFHIAGEGEALDSLKELASNLKLSDSIVFHGKVDDDTRERLYRTSWFSVQPSSFEGWGITVIESNSYGTPVIASNVPGLKDSVIRNKTGILVEPKNVRLFATAIEKLIADKKLRHQMSKNAMKRSQKFDWSNNSREFLYTIKQYLHKRFNLNFVNKS